MKNLKLRPGALDELAAELGATSSQEAALLLGITTEQLEELRYGGAVAPGTAAALAQRAQQLRQVADTITDAAA